MFKLAQIIERSNRKGPPGPMPIDTTEWEFNIVLELFKSEQPTRILEVGSYYGATLANWLENCKKNARVVSVDVSAGSPQVQFIWDKFDRNTNDFIMIEKESNAIASSLASIYGPYDWIFINSLNGFDDIYDDWREFVPLATNDGIVVLHNIAKHKKRKINDFWRSIQKMGYVTQEVCATNTENGMGIVYL